MHLTVHDLELGRAQAVGRAAGMAAGLQAEFVAVPGTHDVGLVLVELQHPRALLTVDRLDDPLVDAPLADRTLPMGALIVPGHELAIDLEHADLGAVAGHHLAAAFGELLDLPDRVRLHYVPLRTSSPRLRYGARF